MRRRYNQNPNCGVVIMCNALEEVYHEKRSLYEAKLNELNELVALTQSEDGEPKREERE